MSNELFINELKEKYTLLLNRTLKAEEALRQIREAIPSQPKMPVSFNILEIIDNYFSR